MLTDNSVPVASKAAPARSGPSLSADAHLQASRRLDWRFLLPDPNLGHVACVGAGQGELVNSLRLFSDSLTLLASPEVGQETDYDVVVAHAPEPAHLPAMAGLVASGGALYLELYGTSWWLRKGQYKGLRHPAKFVAQLKRANLGQIHAYWCWPNFHACTRIIPLDHASSLRFALSSPQNSPIEPVKTMAIQGLIRSGLLARLVPCFSLVARRVTP